MWEVTEEEYSSAILCGKSRHGYGTRYPWVQGGVGGGVDKESIWGYILHGLDGEAREKVSCIQHEG